MLLLNSQLQLYIRYYYSIIIMHERELIIFNYNNIINDYYVQLLISSLIEIIIFPAFMVTKHDIIGTFMVTINMTSAYILCWKLYSTIQTCCILSTKQGCPYSTE